MPTLLDETLIADTLESLPGWHGDSSRLWREVDLDDTQLAELRRQVAVDAEAMGHTPTFEGNRVVLTTPDAGGVTELDVVMASHVSDLVHRISNAEPGVEAQRDDETLVVFRAPDLTGEPSQPRTNTALFES